MRKKIIVKLLTRTGVRRYRVLKKGFNSRYVYNRRKGGYKKRQCLTAIYRYILFPTDLGAINISEDYDHAITAFDKEDRIGSVSTKDLFTHFRRNNLFPMEEIKAGALRGEESLTLLTPFVYEKGKSYARHVVKHYKREYGGGLP